MVHARKYTQQRENFDWKLKNKWVIYYKSAISIETQMEKLTFEWWLGLISRIYSYNVASSFLTFSPLLPIDPWRLPLQGGIGDGGDGKVKGLNFQILFFPLLFSYSLFLFYLSNYFLLPYLIQIYIALYLSF